tara:strand:- start:225 stop:833 length:609 start_codon:yes stop_codon:yes gene_type:complete
MLIGLVGLIGSGKDTVAERLVSHHGYVRDSFAKSLKDAVSNIFSWDREMLEGKTDSSRHWREQPDKFWSERFGKPVTPRWVLQYFGTEVCRQGMLDSIWIDSCLARYKGQNTVISDTRFVNEIKNIRKLGGKIVLVKRTEIPNKKSMMESGAHQSEWDWIGSDYDYILENTHTIESLNKQIFDMTNHLLPSPQSAIPNPEYF